MSKPSKFLSHPFNRILSLLVVPLFLLGCATMDEKEMMLINEQQAETIKSLNDEVYRLNLEMQDMVTSRQGLENAKTALEQELHAEMESGNLSVEMERRGLVVTMLDQILFDSGKADLKDSSRNTLDSLAAILQEKVGENMIFVEGHTDNIPIRFSRWKSNWDLSTARATEVIHYFVHERAVNPQRMVASGYGEFQPVADNGSEAGRRQNRRVEVVISPKKMLVPGQPV